MKKKLILYCVFCFTIFSLSCKKEISSDNKFTSVNESSSPSIRITSASPKGILYFSSKKEFENFMGKLKNMPSEEWASLLPQNFNSLSKYFKEYKEKSKKTELNSQINKKNVNNVENLEEGSLQDYYYSQYSNLVPDDLLPEVLNDQLQIFIADNLYQITRAGVFEVEETQIDNYSSWYNTNSTNIWETPEYIPQNEIQLDNDTYQVSEGITRTLLSVDDIIENSSTPSQPILLQPPHTGINPSAGPNIPMQLVTVGENFKGKGIIGGISNNRRFIFEAYNINYVFWSSVGIEAKLQRLRRFLWASYYGESFADELIVGADNMDLETTYFFPTPEYMAMMQMANPQFNGLVNLKLGNFIAQAWNFSFSVNTRLYSNNFTSADLSSFLNGQLNQYINGKVDPIAERIKNGFVNWADPSFQTRVRNEAMQIRNVKNQSLLRFTIINGYKTQGYSNKNNWRFDWNVMFSTSGQTAYTYNMKAGNFIGKARVGNDWYGIRIVRW